MDDNAVELLRGEHTSLEGLFARVSSPDEDRPAVLQELMRTLAAHLSVEKQMLLPVLRDQVGDGDSLASDLDAGHGRAEHILTMLERRKTNSPDVPELVTELMDLTTAHIAAAEERVFPALERFLGAEELTELGRRMASEERLELTHAHPGLPDSGPLTGVTHKVAQVIDHLRDRSTDIGQTSS